jgi:hypothetical protein
MRTRAKSAVASPSVCVVAAAFLLALASIAVVTTLQLRAD